VLDVPLQHGIGLQPDRVPKSLFLQKLVEFQNCKPGIAPEEFFETFTERSKFSRNASLRPSPIVSSNQLYVFFL